MLRAKHAEHVSLTIVLQPDEGHLQFNTPNDISLASLALDCPQKAVQAVLLLVMHAGLQCGCLPHSAINVIAFTTHCRGTVHAFLESLHFTRFFTNAAAKGRQY